MFGNYVYTMKNEKVVSIIVPVLNDANRLEACLASLKGQLNDKVECIVVDEKASTVSSKNVADQYSHTQYLQVEKGKTVPYKRNVGAKHASGRYLYFIDADMTFPEGYMDYLVHTLQTEQPLIGFVPERTTGKSWLSNMKNFEKKVIEKNIYLSGARIYEKDFFWQLKGYSEQLSNGEDLDMSDRAINKSQKYIILDKHVFHDETSSDSLVKHLKKKFRYGTSSKQYLQTGDAAIKRGTSHRFAYFTDPKVYKNPFLGLQFVFFKALEIVTMLLGMVYSLIIPPHKEKIVFLGTHGQNNLGDEFLLESFMQLLLDRYEVYVNSYNPEQTRKKFHNRIHVFATDKNMHVFLWHILTCKAIVFGGGNIIKELYTEYGGEQYGVLNKLSLITTIAKKVLQKKLIFLNIGIGPIATDRGWHLASRIISAADHMSVRDSYSLHYAKELGFNKVIQVPDSVFSLDVAVTGKTDTQVSKLNRVVVNLCPNIDTPQNWEPFLDAMEVALEEIYKKNQKCEVIGLPMQWDFEKNDDLVTLEGFRKRLQKELPGLQVSIEKPKNAQHICEIVQKCDVLLSERLHLLILATVVRKPFVGLMYDVKVKALLKDIGLEKCGVDMAGKMQKDIISKKVDYVLANYGSIVNQQDNVTKKNKELLIEYFETVKQII